MIPVGWRQGCEYYLIRDQLLPEIQKRGLIVHFNEHYCLPFYLNYDKFSAAEIEDWRKISYQLKKEGQWRQPDFSDKKDMQKFIKNILLLLKDRPETGVIGLMYHEVDDPFSHYKHDDKLTGGDFWLRGANQLAEAVAKEYPNVIVEPITGYRGRAPVDTKPNPKLRLLWQKWQDLFQHCRGGILWYYFGYFNYTPKFFGVPEIPEGKTKYHLLYNKGKPFIGVQYPYAVEKAQGTQWSQAFYFYSAMRYHWNKTLSRNALVDDYVRMYYPNSAEIMGKYIMGFQAKRSKDNVFNESEKFAHEAFSMVEAGKITEPLEVKRIEKAYMLVRLVNNQYRLILLSKKVREMAGKHAKRMLTPKEAAESRTLIKEIVSVYNKYQSLLEQCKMGAQVYPIDSRSGDLLDKRYSINWILNLRPRSRGGVSLIDFMNTYTDGSIIWWEAEDAVKTNLKQQFKYSPQSDEERKLLSGGKWIGFDGNRIGPILFAQYNVSVSQTDTYYLWVRKWDHYADNFRWRFDDQAWYGYYCYGKIYRSKLADKTGYKFILNRPPSETVKIRGEKLSADWMYIGDVNLTKGKHILHVELLKQEGQSANSAYDCFVLTSGAFTPRGTKKPKEWEVHAQSKGSRSEGAVRK